MPKFLKSNSAHSTQSHFFQIRCFLKPVICLHCNDFIWGSGFTGYCCNKCSKCVHNKCKSFEENSTCFNNNKLMIDKISSTALFPIKYWPVELVGEWLIVVNLDIFSVLFESKKINGDKLLAINTKVLEEMRICDPFDQIAILEAKNELIRRADLNSNSFYINQIISEENEGKINYKNYPYNYDHHHFILHTFSKSTNCKMCKFPLLGIIHQGLQCQKCGIVTHRQCSHLGLPECKSNPEVFKPRKKLIFGANLIDLMTEIEGLEAPLILQKLFKNIEERAYQNNEDLYDIYNSKSDVSQIEKIKDYINENGLELVNFDIYDLKTLTALVKEFLRDLQDSIISECLYEKFISLIQLVKKNDLLTILTQNMNVLHFRSLKFIILHIIRVWNHQNKLNNSFFIPDKLFHIFKSILIRPKWENITQILYNRDQQILIIQRLILDLDWGIDLPTFQKINHASIKNSNEIDLRRLSNNELDKNPKQLMNILIEDTSDWNIEKLYHEFSRVFETIEKSTMLLKKFESKIRKSEENLEKSKISLAAYNKVIELYTNQLDEINRYFDQNDLKKTESYSSTQILISKMIQMNLKKEECVDDVNLRLESLMNESKIKLNERIEEFTAKTENAKLEIYNFKQSLTKLESEIENLMSGLIENRSKRDKYYASLIKKGENHEKIREHIKKISNIDLDQSFDSRKSSIDSII